MFKLILLLAIVSLLLTASAWAVDDPKAQPGPDEPAAPHPQVVAAVTGPLNQVKPFTPALSIDAQQFNRDRHVPMINATAPWGPTQFVPMEVPEYVHGYTGEKRPGAFLFAGRSLKTAADIGGVRYASKTPPKWAPNVAGGLSVDNELEGDLVMRFRVIPHDRMIEIRVGLTNGGKLPVKGVWTQLCSKSYGLEGLTRRHVDSSWMLIGGELVTWSVTGQDLDWLKAHLKPGKDDEYKDSNFFMAHLGAGPIAGKLEFQKSGSGIFTLGKRIDVPAIAKLDAEKKRGLIVYSPSADKIFYNVLQPCFHADPQIGTVLPGATCWSQTYIIYFQGDAKAMMNALSAAHRQITAPPAPTSQPDQSAQPPGQPATPPAPAATTPQVPTPQPGNQESAQ